MTRLVVVRHGEAAAGFAEAAGFDEGDAESAMPSFMWVDAASVAAEGVGGLEKGRMVVIPGIANRVTATVGPLLPKTALLPIMVNQHPALKGR